VNEDNKMKATLNWLEGMKFSCENRGHRLMIDASPDHGGSDSAPTPKELILDAMMGCTAMDVVSILKKMRQEIREFTMEVEAEKTSIAPTHFKKALLIFNLTGDILPDKVMKAVDSSLTKYCGVNYMISKTCEISYKLILNGQEIKEAKVQFIEPSSEPEQ
jgi:putative redox protein